VNQKFFEVKSETDDSHKNQGTSHMSLQLQPTAVNGRVDNITHRTRVGLFAGWKMTVRTQGRGVVPVYRWTQKSKFWSLGCNILPKPGLCALQLLFLGQVFSRGLPQKKIAPQRIIPPRLQWPTTTTISIQSWPPRRKWPPSANTLRRRAIKSVAGTNGCYYDLTISHEIGQRQQTRGDKKRWQRMREGDGGGLEMTKVEARGGPPVVDKRPVA
jgi:hypothetical protein